MSGSLDHSTSSDQEQLVAYLDGELTPEEAALVERRLSDDEAFRRLLRKLQETWDLLDDLPQPTVDESFTNTTVEMVAVKMSEEIEDEQQRWHGRRSNWRMLQAAAVMVGVAIGFWGVRHFQQSADRAILQDLSVIEHVDLYAEVDDVDFLEQLLDEGIFAEPLDEDQASELP